MAVAESAILGMLANAGVRGESRLSTAAPVWEASSAPDSHQRNGSDLNASSQGVAGRTGWIVSPWFDVLLIANVFWVLALLPGYVSQQGTPYVAFWTAYFIATPHRWMTISLAALDPDRRHGRGWLFVLMALGVAGLIAATWLISEDLRCLALFYALIVGWHFASQHAGILRMYSRKAGGGRRWLETWPPRMFILYAALRLMPGFDPLMRYFHLELGLIDWVVLAVPVVMLAVECADGPHRRLPKLIYLSSICGLYASLILAAHYRAHVLSFALLAAATVFHSVEYLAVVTHYARRRQKLGSTGLFQKIARHWTTIFVWFLLSCGLIYSFGDRYLVTVWFTINLWASILHCGYDGLMWKLRDPATARLLDVEIAPRAQTVNLTALEPRAT